MRISLRFGLPGAVAVPILYEIYANVSNVMSFVLLGAWVIFIGIKFYPLPLKPAFVGISAFIAYTVCFGFVLFFPIHSVIKGYLEKNSTYFQLDLQQSAVFWLYAVLIYFLLFLFGVLRVAATTKRPQAI